MSFTVVSSPDEVIDQFGIASEQTLIQAGEQHAIETLAVEEQIDITFERKLIEFLGNVPY